MQSLTKGIQNNPLAQISARAPAHVLSAIEGASAKTGVNFAYMVQQASAESSFNPDAKAKTSSATGLYQFIKSTWMDMINRHGDKYGVDTDGMSRNEILELRKDPKISSSMAAEFASENEQFLEAHWAKGEKEIGPTELYFAHFMGAGGASAFLKARDSNPLRAAADLFPQAARSNKGVFYDKNTGRAKSIEEVYAFFDKKFQVKEAPIETPKPYIMVAEHNADAVQIADNDAMRSRVYTSMYTAQKNLERNMHDRSLELLAYAPPRYNALLQNPMELMLLTQLDLPTGQTRS